jgi:hypothetical protein
MPQVGDERDNGGVTQTYKEFGTKKVRKSRSRTVRKDLGTEPIPICRPKFVFFRFSGLRPSTPHWIFFDKVDVTKYVNTSFTLDQWNSQPRNSQYRNPGDKYKNETAFPTALGGPTNASGPLNSDANGEISGIFYLQRNETLSFPTGDRIMTAIDLSVLNKKNALSYAEAQYTAKGIYDVYYTYTVRSYYWKEVPNYDWVNNPVSVVESPTTNTTTTTTAAVSSGGDDSPMEIWTPKKVTVNDNGDFKYEYTSSTTGETKQGNDTVHSAGTSSWEATVAEIKDDWNSLTSWFKGD